MANAKAFYQTQYFTTLYRQEVNPHLNASYSPILNDPLRGIVDKLRAIAQVQFLSNAIAIGFDGLDAEVQSFRISAGLFTLPMRRKTSNSRFANASIGETRELLSVPAAVRRSIVSAIASLK